MITTKTLIPNKEWILKNQEEKVGSITRLKKGYKFFRKGNSFIINDINELISHVGNITFPKNILENKQLDESQYSIYNYPCSSKPFEPLYNLKKKLPIFAKSSKSKSQYCAGYYVIKFKKNWVKSFCPKLITLERYKYFGPYKTEAEMKTVLNLVNKNETI